MHWQVKKEFNNHQDNVLKLNPMDNVRECIFPQETYSAVYNGKDISGVNSSREGKIPRGSRIELGWLGFKSD